MSIPSDPTPGDRYVVRPTARYAWLETGLVAALVAAAGLWLGFSRGHGPMLTGAVAGIAVLGAVAYYMWRFYRRAPKAVELDLEGIRILHRGGARQEARWDGVTRATHHGASGGLYWALEHRDGTIEVRDDGISAAGWDRLSDWIRHAGAAHDFPCTSTGVASAFDDDNHPNPFQ